jgi:hypothetical protein
VPHGSDPCSSGRGDHPPDATPSTGGFGVNVSGVLVPRWSPNDRIKFASNNGWGIGKYITNLGTLGGQDAVYDSATDSLRALPVSSGYFGYERTWRPTIVSAFTYGIVNVANLDIQPPDALKRTQRTTFNVTWSPVRQADIAVEFLLGTRVNKDGQRGGGRAGPPIRQPSCPNTDPAETLRPKIPPRGLRALRAERRTRE